MGGSSRGLVAFRFSDHHFLFVIPSKRRNLLLQYFYICRCLFVCHSAAKRRNLLLPVPLHLPLLLCLSFRSEAEESASASAFTFAVAPLFVIPQRSGGICFCQCLYICRCPFVCHSAAKRRNLLLSLTLKLSVSPHPDQPAKQLILLPLSLLLFFFFHFWPRNRMSSPKTT